MLKKLCALVWSQVKCEITLTGSPWTNNALELGTEEDIVMALFTVGFSKEMLVLAWLLSNSFMDYNNND